MTTENDPKIYLPEFTPEEVVLSQQIKDAISNKIRGVLGEMWSTPSLRDIAPVIIGQSFDSTLSHTWVRSAKFPGRYFDITMHTTEWPSDFSVKYAEYNLRLKNSSNVEASFSNRSNMHATDGLVQYDSDIGISLPVPEDDLKQLIEAVTSGAYERPQTKIIGMQ